MFISWDFAPFHLLVLDCGNFLLSLAVNERLCLLCSFASKRERAPIRYIISVDFSVIYFSPCLVVLFLDDVVLCSLHKLHRLARKRDRCLLLCFACGSRKRERRKRECVNEKPRRRFQVSVMSWRGGWVERRGGAVKWDVLRAQSCLCSTGNNRIRS